MRGTAEPIVSDTDILQQALEMKSLPQGRYLPMRSPSLVYTTSKSTRYKALVKIEEE